MLFPLRISRSLLELKKFGSAGFHLAQMLIVFFFFLGNSVVVLTHGYVKKSQRTPKQEIERAEAYRRDFLKRGQKDE
jgi:phage-related protein